MAIFGDIFDCCVSGMGCYWPGMEAEARAAAKHLTMPIAAPQQNNPFQNVNSATAENSILDKSRSLGFSKP